MTARKTTRAHPERTQPQATPEPAPVPRHVRDHTEQCARLADTPVAHRHAKVHRPAKRPRAAEAVELRRLP